MSEASIVIPLELEVFSLGFLSFPYYPVLATIFVTAFFPQ
jgi:hypothetical protein